MRVRTLLTAGALFLGSVAFLAPATPTAHAAGCPWVGSTAPVDQRVAQVMAQITQSEEISLVHGVSGSYVGDTPAVARLCIPALSLEDGPAGVADGMTGVTQLPAPVAGAATWDTAAVRGYGSLV